MTPTDSSSWIDRVVDKLPASTAGQTVVGYIGGNPTMAAVGVNIVQVAHQVLGDPKPSDAREIANALQELRAELQRLAPRLNEKNRYLAEDKISTIEKELTEHPASPSGDLIRAAGDWLVQNVPELAHAVLSIFLPEPVGRVIAKAGGATIEWIKALRNRVTAG